MAFEKKPPEWLAEGAEPPATLKQSGFTPGYKPPAAYFNWFWHAVSEALAELQGMTPSDINAAPAGYGLGGTATLLTSADDLNNIRANGWYYWSTSNAPANAPAADLTFKPTAMRVWTESGNVCMQECADIGTSCGIKLQRALTSAKVGEWEWDNPPMVWGTEYRTTERIGGNAVYKRNVNGEIQYHLDGETEWIPYAPVVGAVALDGSEKMTGSLKIKGYGEIDASSTLAYFKAIKDINNFRYLRVINPLLTDYTLEKSLQYSNVAGGSEKVYDLFGTHNKPAGSYTGNGSATNRTIAVGGLGEVMSITSDTGMALVTNRGAICLNRQTGAVSGLKSWEVNYTNGVLTIATTSDFVNKSGYISESGSYWYQVL